MIKNVNINFFKNNKAKLCGIGMMIGLSLTGCSNINVQDTPPSNNITVQDLIEESETASIEVDFENTSVLTDRDILGFTTIDTNEILGAVKTNSDIREISLPVGEYYVTSDYLEPTEFEVENKDQEFVVHADYATKELKVVEKTDMKNQVK